MHITRKFWSPKFCGSYAPLNLEISWNLLLKQLVSATPLKLQNRISWNLVGCKDTVCSCITRNFWSSEFCGSYASLNFAMTIWSSTCNPCFSTFDQIFFVFHGLKTGCFFYSLKLNFICYLNNFFTFDYSLWDGGSHTFLWAKTNFKSTSFPIFVFI